MFNSIVPDVVKPTDIIFKSPKFMDIELENGERKVIEIEKGASNYLYSMYKIKENTSKEVYKKSEDLWKSLIKVCEDLSTDSQDNFYLQKDSNVFLVTSTGELIDVFDTKTEEAYEEFEEKYSNFKLEITEMTKTRKIYRDGANGLIKLIFYRASWDITNSEYTPIMILELNPIKANYDVYTGIYLFSKSIIIPSLSACSSYNHYQDLVRNLDIDNIMSYSDDRAEELYKDYLSFLDNQVEISARELLSLLKKVGYKLQLNNDNDLGDIGNLEEEESNEKIRNFFNTFKFTTGETAVDILNLSELKKIFRYNKLTFLDLLEILSKEYLNQDNSKVTVEILSSLIYILYDKNDDKKQVESIRKEIE